VSPVRHELGSCIPEDGDLQSKQRSETFKIILNILGWGGRKALDRYIAPCLPSGSFVVVVVVSFLCRKVLPNIFFSIGLTLGYRVEEM
jgi:hypothetical protein